MGNSCSAQGHEAEMLLQSARDGDQESVLLALQKYPELLGCKKSLLASKTVWHCAAKAGSKDMLQTMVDFALSEDSPFGQLPPARRKHKLQALLNVENAKGQTPLVIACSHGHSEAVAVLVSAGADVYIGDRAAETGLHFAARNGHADCIRAMMDSIPDSQARREHFSLQDVPSMSGLAPLHFAVAFDHMHCVEVLLQRGAYLLSRTRYFSSDLGIALAAGSSPLHVGAQLGRTEAVRAILKHQASQLASNSRLPDARWARNSDGFTPYQVACRRAQDVELVEMLHPLTDLGIVFNLQELAAPETGVAKLSFIAAAALQAKLLFDIKRVASAQVSRATTGRPPSRPAPSPFTRHTVALDGGSLDSPPPLELGIASMNSSHRNAPAPGGSRLGRPHSDTEAAHVLQAAEQAAAGREAAPPPPAACKRAGSGPAAAAPAGGAGGAQRAAEPDAPGTPGREGCLGSQDPDLERVMSGALCALCFDRVPDVGVAGCQHMLCSQCAEAMCSRVSNKPLTCPFCRKSIAAFVESGL